MSTNPPTDGMETTGMDRMPAAAAQDPQAAPDARQRLAVGVDIGGTKIAGALVSADGHVQAQEQRPSPANDPAAIADTIAAVVAHLSAGASLPVGIAAAGYINAARDEVLFSPNLAWRHERLKERLADRLGARVVVENDANAAAWGEFCVGAGVGCRHMVMMTLGTGVGAGIVLNGALYRGGHGIAAELGHMSQVPGGLLCGCGQHGCIEQYASGSALTRMAREAAASGEPGVTGIVTAARELAAVGLGDTAEAAEPEVSGEAVTVAAQRGDVFAAELLARFARHVAQGAADVTALLDPELIVIGGGVVTAGDLLLGPVRDAYRELLTGGSYRAGAKIVAASGGPSAGVIGAGLLALNED